MYRTRGRLVFGAICLACLLLLVGALVFHWSELVAAGAVLVNMANLVMFQRAQRQQQQS